MKKVIGIIDQGGLVYDETSLGTGSIGGSETWLIEVAHEFASRGYHVIVFNGGSEQHSHFDEYGVEWVPFSSFSTRIQYQYFTHIIILRIYETLLNLIEESGCCDNVSIMCEDWGCGYWYHHEGVDDCYYLNINEALELRSPILKKIVVLSNFHQEWIEKNMLIPSNMIEIIPNGINIKDIVYSGLKQTRDNTILWSSRPERGLDILCDEILPRLKRLIPDAKVHICSYTDIPDHFKNRENEGIFYLGKYTKHELYKEMSNHKVWFYPAVYPETFCITSLETALNGNLPVLPFRHGMATTFEPFKGFFMKHRFKEIWSLDGVIVKDNEHAINEAVSMIAEYMTNFEKYKNLQESLYHYVIKNYSWTQVVNKWEKMFQTFK